MSLKKFNENDNNFNEDMIITFFHMYLILQKAMKYLRVH
jgi:hypothetical protein